MIMSDLVLFSVCYYEMLLCYILTMLSCLSTL